MFCAKCGQKLIENSAFCGHCGARAAQQEAATQAVSPHVSMPDEPPALVQEQQAAPSKKLKALIPICATLVIVLAAGTFFALQSGMLPFGRQAAGELYEEDALAVYAHRSEREPEDEDGLYEVAVGLAEDEHEDVESLSEPVLISQMNLPIEEISDALMAYYIGYLNAINEQNVAMLSNVTPQQAQLLDEWIFGVNSGYFFYFNHVILDLDSIEIHTAADAPNINFLTEFSFGFRRRGGGGITNRQSVQSVTMIYDEPVGQWLVDFSDILDGVAIGSNQIVLLAPTPNTVRDARENLLGHWRGTYYNNRGIMGYEFYIFRDGGDFRALVDFFPVADSPPAQMSGTTLNDVQFIAATGEFEMIPIEYIYMPEGWTASGQIGVLHSDTFSGHLRANANLTFSVNRVA